MILVGELINMTRKKVEQAWKDRDEEAIASMLDLLAGHVDEFSDDNHLRFTSLCSLGRLDV